jgi:hypothetical protein
MIDSLLVLPLFQSVFQIRYWPFVLLYYNSYEYKFIVIGYIFDYKSNYAKFTLKNKKVVV